MTETLSDVEIPIPEGLLRNLSKDLSRVIPNFAEKESTLGVKELREVIGPILDTAESADLSSSHRAVTFNALCAIVENCQASSEEYARACMLEDYIWGRLFEVYLQRSDNAKAKSMRQMLLVLTNVLLNDQSTRSSELRDRAAKSFIDIICQRQDRLKVKPALQGLAYFLQRDLVSIPQLIELHSTLLKDGSNTSVASSSSTSLLNAFLAWVVHHDTSLSAGHLVKNFLAQIRHSSQAEIPTDHDYTLPLWMDPVVKTLCQWPDRIQEFKTHVFPHCFLPDIDEFLRFLSYLHFTRHIEVQGDLLAQMVAFRDFNNGLGDFEEFRILLATIQTGKELGVIKDVDFRVCCTIEVHGNSLYLPDDIFGGWLSHLDAEVRLAGLFLSVYSTAVTKPITGGIIKSLKRNIIHLHTDTDANFRREILGHIQKLFDRLRGSTATLAKQAKAIPSSGHRIPIPKECFAKGISLKVASAKDPLLEPLNFIVWYTHFLEWELRSTASYQRRITALRALTIVLRSGLDSRVPYAYLSKSAQGQLHWAHELQIASPKLIRLLLDLVLDPFDDIRDASISILQICLESLPNDEKAIALEPLPRFLARAEAMMLRTGRADYADGVARAYALLFSLSSMRTAYLQNLDKPRLLAKIDVFRHLIKQSEETIKLASANLSEAVNGRPIHGTFAATRYIVDQDHFYTHITQCPAQELVVWKELHERICVNFEKLWVCVQDVLCADAPEGHIPEDMEEETSLDTKEILSYSWRGLKEASILIRTVISKAPIGIDDQSLIHPNEFEKLGRLCFTQLLELRHRGAFSTVAQTFAAFCRRCVSADDKTLRALPEKWYQETLSSIQDKAHAITRRSAGIPALMAGIIAAEPQQEGGLFPRAMQDLKAEASLDAESTNIEESRLPQVHALNCIKEVFTTSRLSAASEAYIGEGLELAAKTLNSKIWPIRNCSLMLFKALIERLLGSDEAQDWKERERTKTSRFSYNNYPSLIKILSDLLDISGAVRKSLTHAPDSNFPLDLHGAEGVFPALQIIRQATPPEENRDKIRNRVKDLCYSAHWHLRDMVARTFVSLLRPNELYQGVGPWLWGIADAKGANNAKHGVLLAVKYMMKKLMHNPQTFTNEYVNKMLVEFRGWSTDYYTNSTPPFVKSAFLDVVALLGISLLHRKESAQTVEHWTQLTASISIGPKYGIHIKSAPGDSLLQKSLAQLFFIDRAIVGFGGLDAVVLNKYQTIGDALILLADQDPDACYAALDTLNDIIRFKPASGPVSPKYQILADIHRLLLTADDAEVISKVQMVLAGSLVQQQLKLGFFKRITKDECLRTLEKLETQCLEGPPSNAQSALHLMGFFLDHTFHEYPGLRHTVLKRIARYIRLLRMTIIDTNPFDARFAAVQSISAIRHIWTASTFSKATSTLILGLSIVLYDMLNDDDDEIRDAAAIATTSLLQAQGLSDLKDSVPILTTRRLAKFLTTTFSTCPALSREAVRRLLNIPSPNPLFSIPFATTFAEESKEDNALFVIEKQNLFKDDTLDAALWSQILSSLPHTAIPSDLHSGLTTWVLDALAILTVTAERNEDGALGWTSKPEVFTLGMRVICASEVALKWGSPEASTIRRSLREFADAAITGEVHGLWIEKVERILEGQAIEMLKRAKRSLPVV